MSEQKRKNIQLLVGVLVALSIYVVVKWSPWEQNAGRTTQAYFAIADTAAIDKVVLENNQFLSVLEEKEKSVKLIRRLGFSKCRLSLAIPREKANTPPTCRYAIIARYSPLK